MTAPARPTSSFPATSAQPIEISGSTIDGHKVGDPAFYYNGELGVLIQGPLSGPYFFVPVQSGPAVPPAQIYDPPDVETAWRSLMWALGSGLPNGINAARSHAKAIRAVR